MTTFVDTNVLIYALNEGADFHAWALDALQTQRANGPLIICDIVYSELSVGLDSVDKTDEAIQKLAIERIRFSKECLFRAGKAYRAYRQSGGIKNNVLSDFLIGAQAETEAAPLLTANNTDFATYFPTVECIIPPAAQ